MFLEPVDVFSSFLTLLNHEVLLISNFFSKSIFGGVIQTSSNIFIYENKNTNECKINKTCTRYQIIFLKKQYVIVISDQEHLQLD